MAGGIIPEGVWILDEVRSQKLEPASVVLWVVRDNGEKLTWVAVETDCAGEIAINTFEGVYGGPPAIVRGCEFVVSLTSPETRIVCVEGEIPNMGPFRETSVISTNGRQMRVNGEVRTRGEVKRWYEEFNWQGTIDGGAS